MKRSRLHEDKSMSHGDTVTSYHLQLQSEEGWSEVRRLTPFFHASGRIYLIAKLIYLRAVQPPPHFLLTRPFNLEEETSLSRVDDIVLIPRIAISTVRVDVAPFGPLNT